MAASFREAVNVSKTVDRVSRGEYRGGGPRRVVHPDDVVLDDGVGPGVRPEPVRGVLHRQDGKLMASRSSRPVFAKDARWWESGVLAAEEIGCDRSTLYRAVRRRRPCFGVELSFKPWPGVVYVGR